MSDNPAAVSLLTGVFALLCRWQDVIRDCTTVLSLPGHGDNVKALYRRALARQEVGEAQGAIQGEEFESKTLKMRQMTPAD